jgi:ABC-type sugar transport system ATPase subunit
MEEIYRLADRISVLRDGARVLTARADELARAELVKAMVGRDVSQTAGTPAAPEGEVLLRVEELSVESRRLTLDGLSFELRRGEVLGIFGLQGSGASTLLYALGGGLAGVRGRVSLSGAPLRLGSPREALARGVVFLSGDRQASVFPELSILQNLTLSSLERFSRLSFMLRSRELAAAGSIAPRLALGVRSYDAPARTLSGGNQQKIALGRGLLKSPALLLLDDPTRGIDVGAKAEIYRIISELSQAGVGILLAASEMEELTALSHRILVLFRGKPVALFERDAFERARLLSAAMGGSTELS